MTECHPGSPCDCDVCHALKDITQVLVYLEKKALGAMGNVEKLLSAREKLAGYKKNSFGRRLGEARRREAELLQAHSILETIYGFLREDVLNFNEMSFEDRRELFDWLMKEPAAVREVTESLRHCAKKRRGRRIVSWMCSTGWTLRSSCRPTNMGWTSVTQD